jgi:hypothetical protein
MRTESSRRSVLSGLIALPTACAVGAGASAFEIDPVFTAIDEHRRAYGDWISSLDDYAKAEKASDLKKRDPNVERARIAQEDQWGLQEDKLFALICMVPTTKAGLAERLRHLREDKTMRGLVSEDARAVEALLASTEIALFDLAGIEPPQDLADKFEDPKSLQTELLELNK